MTPREEEQLARLKARDLDGFAAALLESVRLYADTEAGRSGMGSPVMAALVYAGIERDVAMLVGAALEAGPSPQFKCICGPYRDVATEDHSAMCYAQRGEAGPPHTHTKAIAFIAAHGPSPARDAALAELRGEAAPSPDPKEPT